MAEEKKVDQTTTKITERHEITGDAQEAGTETSAEKVAADSAKNNPGQSSSDSGSNDSDKGHPNEQANQPKDGGGLTHK